MKVVFIKGRSVQVCYSTFPNLGNNWMTAVISWSIHVTGWATLAMSGGRIYTWPTFISLRWPATRNPHTTADHRTDMISSQLTQSRPTDHHQLNLECSQISRYPTLVKYWYTLAFNPLTAKIFSLNFHPLEVVSRWRDPQLQVSENYSDLTKWRSTVLKYCWLMSYFIFTMFKKWYVMC